MEHLTWTRQNQNGSYSAFYKLIFVVLLMLLYLLEAFAEKDILKGTCYKASKWIHLSYCFGI